MLLSKRDILLEKSYRILPALSNKELEKFIENYKFVFNNKTEDLPNEVKYYIIKHIRNIPDIFKMLTLNKSWYNLCKPNKNNDKFWLSLTSELVVENRYIVDIDLSLEIFKNLKTNYNLIHPNCISCFDIYLFAVWLILPSENSLDPQEIYQQLSVKFGTNLNHDFMKELGTMYMLFNIWKYNNIISKKRKRSGKPKEQIEWPSKYRWFYTKKYTWFQYMIFPTIKTIESNLCFTEDYWYKIINTWVEANTYFDNSGKFGIIEGELKEKRYNFLQLKADAPRKVLYKNRNSIVRKIMDIYLIKVGSIKL